MKKVRVLFVLLCVILVFTACAQQIPTESMQNSPSVESSAPVVSQSEEATPEPVELKTATLRLNWTAQGSHAPIFYGIAQGIFEKYGISLTAGEGKGSGTTVNIIASGGDTFGWADAGTTFNLISQGATVKVIAPGYTKLSSAVISIAENSITKPEDIIGKKIGITEGDGPHKLFGAFLKQVGISEDQVELVAMDATAKVPSLLTGQVDAILGGYDDQPFSIKAQGYEPTVIAYADYGVNMIGMSFIASDETIANDPELVKAFVAAVAECWAEAYKNPEGALDALLAEFPDLDRTTASNQLQAAFSCLISDYSTGLMNVSQALYDQTIDICVNYMGLPAGLAADDLYTTDFLPDQIIKLE